MILLTYKLCVYWNQCFFFFIIFNGMRDKRCVLSYLLKRQILIRFNILQNVSTLIIGWNLNAKLSCVVFCPYIVFFLLTSFFFQMNRFWRLLNDKSEEWIFNSTSFSYILVLYYEKIMLLDDSRFKIYHFFWFI